MVFNSLENRLGSWDELPRVEVTSEQLENQLSEWLRLARLHVSEPVLVYKRSNGPMWSLDMGRIRDDIDGETDINFLQGVVITESSTANSDGHNVKARDFPIQLGFKEAYDYFQRSKSYLGDRVGIARFQIAFGNEAIVNWFTDNGKLSAAEPYSYIQMIKQLGFEPIITPEMADSIARRKNMIMVSLVKMALRQKGLSESIDRVYESIGHGIQSLHGGQAIEMAPETKGEADFRTHHLRQERDDNTGSIGALKQELITLGINEATYYHTIASRLGLDLPAVNSSETGTTK
jgi:hypothetical protein